MKKLPIGIQTFSELINGHYYYVDKTSLIVELVDAGKYYFLARPRRFGKSLLVSTLKSAFAGEKAIYICTIIGSGRCDILWFILALDAVSSIALKR